jgi:hypothetical protein
MFPGRGTMDGEALSIDIRWKRYLDSTWEGDPGGLNRMGQERVDTRGEAGNRQHLH